MKNGTLAEILGDSSLWQTDISDMALFLRIIISPSRKNINENRVVLHIAVVNSKSQSLLRKRGIEKFNSFHSCFLPYYIISKKEIADKQIRAVHITQTARIRLRPD